MLIQLSIPLWLPLAEFHFHVFPLTVAILMLADLSLVNIRQIVTVGGARCLWFLDLEFLSETAISDQLTSSYVLFKCEWKLNVMRL